METRRFPPPWAAEDIGAAFVVTDSGTPNNLLLRDRLHDRHDA